MSHAAILIIRDEHRALAAMLRSLLNLVADGPGDQPHRFFDVLRAMLFYIDEFPVRPHHPKESKLLFLLLVGELMGEPRRSSFVVAAQEYVMFYLEHMRIEESQLLPVAERSFSDADWAELDTAFATDRDPLAAGTHDTGLDRLFTRIVMSAPAPIGVGASLESSRHEQDRPR